MYILEAIKTEKAVGKLEFENTVTFKISEAATKKDVKKEVEELFNVKVANVRTYYSAKGTKHAIVKLKKGQSTENITTKLKFI